MADKRASIRMSTEEIWALLEQARNLQVATLDKDGSAHLTTLWYAIDGQSIVFDTYLKSQKAVNLLRDPRISVLVEGGDSYRALHGVSVKGVAEQVEDPQESVRLKVMIGQRYAPDADVCQLEEQARASRGKRAVFRIRPQKFVSWDHRKL